MPKPILVALLFLFSAPASAGLPAGKGPCSDGSQCSSGTCVEINSDSYCSQACGLCPPGMFCDAKLFAAVGLKVCVKGQASAPPKIQSPPRLPCHTDAQCQGALVCAQFMGRRDCTMPCATDQQCKPPAMMGIKMDFLRCLPDEGNATRRACLPRKECLNNPMPCMGVNPAGMANMAGQMMAMGNAMEQAMDMDGSSGGVEKTQQRSSSRSTSNSFGNSNLGSVKKSSRAMSAKRFQTFLAEVKAQNFESERNSVIGLAAQRNHFSCAQVTTLLKGINVASEQLAALKLMAGKIVDKEDSHLILSAFTFDSDKSKARVLLSR
jgi:hypothetical protein